MFGNKYAHINDLNLLKGMKPRKGLVAQGPDLANFITSNVNLKKYANFGLEMLKFLPDFEQIRYKEGMMAGPQDEVVEVAHGGQTSEVKKSYWDAFNQYGIEDLNGINGFTDEISDLEEDLGSDYVLHYDDVGYVTDANGDGKITNSDTIQWVESHHGGSFDGMITFRRNYIASQHHRVPSFGPFGSGDLDGMAGSGMGQGFRNLDFEISGSEWNHIMQRGGLSQDNPQALEIADQPYFIGDLLSAIGKSWSQVKGLSVLQGENSYYDAVMNGSYQTLSPENALLFAAAMFESRERAWKMMTEVFGDVEDTRNDAAMKAQMQEFISSSNSQLNHHAISLFPFFLYINHSFQNRVTMYYERDLKDGYVDSVVDAKKFLEFSQWLGSEEYENHGVAYDGSGKLYQARQSISGLTVAAYNLLKAEDPDDLTPAQLAAIGKYEAISEFIDNWFGAAYQENGRPLWEGYEDETDGGTWQELSGSLSGYVWEGGAWQNRSLLEAKKVSVEHGSYGWDRKFTGNTIRVKYQKPDGTIVETDNFYPKQAVWSKVFNQLYPENYITERLPLNHTSHPNYVSTQFYGMSAVQIMGHSPDYAKNWAVFAIGNLLKFGEGLDGVSIMNRSAQKRQAAAEFKMDTKNWAIRQVELESEKAEDEKLNAKHIAKKLQEKKRAAAASGGGSQKSSHSSSASLHSNKNNYGSGTSQHEKAMQRLRQRLLNASKKHKA